MEISFDTFKAKNTANINKLSLDKDETARVCFLQQSPQLVFIHSFEKIVAGDDGRPIEIQDGNWDDGRPRIKNKTEYVGKLRCLGNEEAVQEYGADPDNCPACKAHIENSNAVKAPTMRILGHVLKYTTKPGSAALANPFGAALLVWDLTAGRFAQLKAIFDEHGSLAEKDLILGPCENKQMQKFTIQVASGDASWKKSKETQDYTKVLLEEGRVEDLASVAGKKPTMFELESKVSEVVRAYNQANNITTQSATYATLLNSEPTAPQEAEEKVDDPAPFEATPAKASAPVVEADPEDGQDEGPDADDYTPSLSDLLKL